MRPGSGGSRIHILSGGKPACNVRGRALQYGQVTCLRCIAVRDATPKIRLIPTRLCRPPHDPIDLELVDRISWSLILNGWVGRPLVGYGTRRIQLITGSHRYAAAVDAEVTAIPVVVLPRWAWGEIQRRKRWFGKYLLAFARQAQLCSRLKAILAKD